MIDVSAKFNTLRYARAEGLLKANSTTIERVRNNTVPKGDVLQVARAAGIQAAKRTADWIVFCHTLPVDWVELSFELREDSIRVQAELKAIWRTGVEMEAMTAVTAALLNMYDMLKPLDQNIRFSDIQLVEKKGGKSDYTDEFSTPITAAVLVISDSTYQGQREDKSGLIIKSFLEERDITVSSYEIVPDVQEIIKDRLQQLAEIEEIDLILTTGGTGFGPKDLTPEATKKVIEKRAPGIEEAIRRHGKDRTPYAMLSREVAGLKNNSIIINLPGSSKGAEESLQALFPGLLHGFPMIWGGGHDKPKSSNDKLLETQK
jgi:molybdenum cofactor biosynthesis protein MoaC